MDAAIKTVEIEEVETYVLCCHNTENQYITTQPILDIFMVTEQRPGDKGPVRWWEKSGINLGHGDTSIEMDMEEEGEGEDDNAEVEEMRGL